MELVTNCPVEKWIKARTKDSDYTTPSKDLYKDFKKWAVENCKELGDFRKKKFNDGLMYWQELSKYGLDLGTPKEPGRNGNKANPRINLVIFQEDAKVAELEAKLIKAEKIADLYKQLCHTLQNT